MTSRPTTAIVVAVVVGVFIAGISAAGFPGDWTSAFSVGTAGVTLVMVFVIQHTQSREQTATQLKLDELIRAISPARNELIGIERSDRGEIQEVRAAID